MKVQQPPQHCRRSTACPYTIVPEAADLAAGAQGDVLEVSAGTGRNLPYYKYAQLNSLTLSDSSKYMLWHANDKFQEKYASRAASLPVSFFLSDAQQLVAPQPALPASNTEAVVAANSSAGQQLRPKQASRHFPTGSLTVLCNGPILAQHEIGQAAYEYVFKADFAI